MYSFLCCFFLAVFVFRGEGQVILMNETPFELSTKHSIKTLLISHILLIHIYFVIPNNDWNHFQANQMFWLADKFIKMQDNKFSIIFLDVKKRKNCMENGKHRSSFLYCCFIVFLSLWKIKNRIEQDRMYITLVQCTCFW